MTGRTTTDSAVGMEPQSGGMRNETSAVEAIGRLEAENAALLDEIGALTKALTGLTCGGSEFFIRKGERYVADIPACVAWVRRAKEDSHKNLVRTIKERNEARESLRHSVEREAGLREALTPLAAAATKREALSSRSLSDATRAVVPLGHLRKARAALDRRAG